ncbi:hypothetical protein IAQ61_000025 [Plenodomus lingam]|uniref:uncharacterized protein n=1 Tax=Leptosphaeria maculans TaxID=5022 RepID=UPI003317E96A|nr:hypothetical protein IAQ61_000025 [Plenodomus lingam]
MAYEGSFIRQGRFAVVEIGPAHTQYHIHAALLSKHSKFFKKALNGPWKEAKERVVKLEDVECATFDVFTDWLYTQRLPEFYTFNNLRISEKDCVHAGQAKNIKAMILAERILAPKFRQTIMESLASDMICHGTPASYTAITTAFEQLPKENHVLRLLIHVQCAFYRPREYDNGVADLQNIRLPNEFLVGVIMRYAEILASPQESIDLNPLDYCYDDDEDDEEDEDDEDGEDDEDDEDGEDDEAM